MNAAEHLEHHLGTMSRGWSSLSLPTLQVCAFHDRPSPGVVTLATLGLSEAVLSMGAGREVRQELLLAAHDKSPIEESARLLLHVADRLLQSGRALLRGEVIPVEGGVPGTVASALYASIPVVFPEGLATLDDTTPPTVFVWLFPLQPAEAKFAMAHGWSAFEDRLESANPDLFDPRREPVA